MPGVPIGLLKLIGSAFVSYFDFNISTNLMNRLSVTMTAAWHGGLAGDDQFVKDPTLRTAISNAMDYWFGRDFTNPACLDSGGTPACPCTNPDNSLWYV